MPGPWPRRLVLLVAPGALALFASLFPTGAPPGNANPDFLWDEPAITVESTVAGDERRHDADLAVCEGEVWIASLEYQPGRGDIVEVRREAGRGTIVARFEAGRAARPTLTTDGVGGLWLSYEHEATGGWELLLSRWDGQEFGTPQRVSVRDHAVMHRAAGRPDGGLWLAWQFERDGQFDVAARSWTLEGPGELHVLGSSPRGDWAPDVAVDANGRAAVAWDTYGANGFDVVVRVQETGGFGPERVVAATPAFEVRPQLAFSPGGTLWCAFERGATNWGREYRAGWTRHADGVDWRVSDVEGPLHRFRSLHLVAVTGGGGVVRPAPPVPMPSRDGAVRRRTQRVTETGVFYERPRLEVDGGGRLWLVYRHLFVPWQGVEPRHHVQGDFRVHARYLAADGWSELLGFDVGQGDGHQRLEVAAIESGVAAVWTVGRTDRRKADGAPGLRSGFLRVAGPPAATESGTRPAVAPGPTDSVRLGEPIVVAPASSLPPRAARVQTEVEGDSYRLMLGDMHRHTDLSLCFVPKDGSLGDTYRYAIEVAGLDFLAITDHTRDIAQGDGLSLLWWRCRKEVGRHTLAPRFFPFFAYERSRGETDHNVITLREDVLRPHTYPHAEFWQELGADTFTIPHQPFNRVLWEVRDDAHRPLLEVYQGCRDRTMEAEAHEGLRRGHRFGLIASSDHMSTSASYAGVWAREVGREPIFRAMQARCTFGATQPLALRVTSGDRWMGQSVARAAEVPVRVVVEPVAGDRPVVLEAVEFWVDGARAERWECTGTGIDRSWTWTSPDTGSWLVVIVRLAEGGTAWASPLWVE